MNTTVLNKRRFIRIAEHKSIYRKIRHNGKTRLKIDQEKEKNEIYKIKYLFMIFSSLLQMHACYIIKHFIFIRIFFYLQCRYIYSFTFPFFSALKTKINKEKNKPKKNIKPNF